MGGTGRGAGWVGISALFRPTCGLSRASCTYAFSASLPWPHRPTTVPLPWRLIQAWFQAPPSGFHRPCGAELPGGSSPHSDPSGSGLFLPDSPCGFWNLDGFDQFLHTLVLPSHRHMTFSRLPQDSNPLPAGAWRKAWRMGQCSRLFHSPFRLKQWACLMSFHSLLAWIFEDTRGALYSPGLGDSTFWLLRLLSLPLNLEAGFPYQVFLWFSPPVFKSLPWVLHPNGWWLWVRVPWKALSQFLCPDSSLQQATGLFSVRPWGVSGVHPVWLLPCFRLPTQSALLGSYQLSCPASGPWHPLPWASQAPMYLMCVPQDTVLLRDFCAWPHVPGEGLEERMRQWVTRCVTRAPWDSSPPPQLTSGIRSLSKAQPTSPHSLLRRLLFRPGLQSRPRASLSSNSSCLGFLAPWFFHRFLTITIT